jgi:tetratricopeptide (TPR) repeat protein/CHAT domain-containing protein
VLALVLAVGSASGADGPTEELKQKARQLSERAVDLFQSGKTQEALHLFEEALACHRKLYPEKQFPDGHHDLAENLNNLGFVLRVLGQEQQALAPFEQALQMRQRLYPKDKFPDGHPELAESLYNVGFVLKGLGHAERALPCYQQALEMGERLYPDGHPHLVHSHNDLGLVLEALGQADLALPHYEQALKMCQRLYPAEQFPRGHAALAQSLNNLGGGLLVLTQAERALPYCQQALEMRQRLYPKDQHPQGHPALAISLSNLGLVLLELGQPERALPYCEQAVEMLQGLYPKDQYPQGHRCLAQGLTDLGMVLKALGQVERALPYFRQALEMRQRLYPKDQFPQGHSDLAAGFTNLGLALTAVGQPERALPPFEQALEMCQRLYPKERFPQGHLFLALSFNNLGYALLQLGQPERALPYTQKGVEAYQRLYPPDRFPQGHPDKAVSLNNLALTLKRLGQPERALPFSQQSLRMLRLLYPAEQFPQGHPYLALGLNNVGAMLLELGQPEQALTHYRQALEMFSTYLEAQAATAPEAQALDLLDSLPTPSYRLLTLARQLDIDPREIYPALWQSRAALTRLLQQRQQALRLTLADAGVSAQVRQHWQRLVEVRRRLSVLPGQAGLKQAQRDALFRELTEQKESLERQLARDLPQLKLDHPRPAELGDHLPEGAVFVDFYRYLDSDKKASELRYVAFVLARGRPVRRVDLGAARSLDDAVDTWLGDIGAGQVGSAAAQVGRQLWPRLSEALPGGTHTLYLAPDGRLSRLPWAALPTGPGKVLLESHRLAVVPHGPFLLDQLRASRQPGLADDRGRVLAVGGVYADLPGSKAEVELLREQAAPREVLVLGPGEATPARVLKELAQARVAHLATHGFFEAGLLQQEQLRVESWHRKLRTGELRMEAGGLGVGLGLRNPLVYTGLVLAADPRDPLAASGRVTAETLVAQPLGQLRLCVLSACETGLGKLTDGEGVQGLQRAFHLAGCPNVIASLWRVDDEATAGLMAMFYDRLWHKGEPPLEALRQAQLAIYYHPERVPTLARERGPKLKEAVDLPRSGRVVEDQNSQRAKTKLWAAFVLSGLGR